MRQERVEHEWSDKLVERTKKKKKKTLKRTSFGSIIIEQKCSSINCILLFSNRSKEKKNKRRKTKNFFLISFKLQKLKFDQTKINLRSDFLPILRVVRGFVSTILRLKKKRTKIFRWNSFSSFDRTSSFVFVGLNETKSIDVFRTVRTSSKLRALQFFRRHPFALKRKFLTERTSNGSIELIAWKRRKQNIFLVEIRRKKFVRTWRQFEENFFEMI